MWWTCVSGVDPFLVMAWLTTSLWMSLRNQYLCNGVDLCDGVDWIPHSNTVLGLQDCSWTCVEHSWTDHNAVHFSLTGLLSFTTVKWINFQLRGNDVLIQVMNRGKKWVVCWQRNKADLICQKAERKYYLVAVLWASTLILMTCKWF